MRQRSEVIRSRGGGLQMPANGKREGLDRLMERWEDFKRHNQVLAGEETRAFAYWLLDVARLAVDQKAHRRQINALRAELAGDRQFLLIVGETGGGRVEITLARGAGREIVGKGVLNPNQLPRSAIKGECLLVTISQPRCRNCGCTNDKACAGGCAWMLPNLCSQCWPHARRRRRRV